MSKRYENEEEILIEKANGAGALLGVDFGAAAHDSRSCCRYYSMRKKYRRLG